MSLDRGDSLFRALVQVEALTHRPVAQGDFEPAARDITRSRGGSDSASAIPAVAGSGPAAPQAKGSGAPEAPWISALNPDKDGEAWGGDIRAIRWPGFVLGVRI